MNANSLQLSTAPDGDSLSASTDGDGPSLTVERRTSDDGFAAALTFTRASHRLVVGSAIVYGDGGSIVRSIIAADGPRLRHRLTIDFAETPGRSSRGTGWTRR